MGVPTSHEGLLPAVEADLTLSLLCVSNASFHPVLDWAVFFFVTLIPRCSRQKCLDSTPGTDNQCVVFCSTAWANEAAARMKKERQTRCILRHNHKELLKIEYGL